MNSTLRLLSIFVCLGLFATPVRAENNAWHKIALDTVHISSMVADPVRPATLYAVTSLGLMKSVDSGANWTSLSEGLPTEIPPSCVAVSPYNSKELYIGYDGKGIFKSQDSGASWQAITEGLPNHYVRCITISPKDPNLLYIGVQNGVAISTNGGQYWHMSSGFRRAVNINAIVIDPKNPQYLFAATGGAGIYKSGNGGVSWRDINEGLSSLSILDLHIDPENPDIVLAGAYHPATPTDLYVGEANGGVYRTVDGGRTWQETSLLNITIFSFTESPDYPGAVWVGAWGGSYRSTDKGETWMDINSGLDNAFLHKVHAMPGTPPVILGGTTFGLLSFTDNEITTLIQTGSDFPTAAWYGIGGAAALALVILAAILRRRGKKDGPAEKDSVW